MEYVITTERIPIKLWLDNVEEGALEQAINLANLPFVFKHIALMPDCHQGYGMPIGGIMATKNVIVPNAVGVDIGCGMCAVKTSLQNISKNILKKIIEKIREIIPVGVKRHSKNQDEKLMPKLDEYLPIVKDNYKKALKQIGTLGGGK